MMVEACGVTAGLRFLGILWPSPSSKCEGCCVQLFVLDNWLMLSLCVFLIHTFWRNYYFFSSSTFSLKGIPVVIPFLCWAA